MTSEREEWMNTDGADVKIGDIMEYFKQRKVK